MNMNFKGDARALNIVHFQKGKVFWNQLDEIYHFSWVHNKKPKNFIFKGNPLTDDIRLKNLWGYVAAQRGVVGCKPTTARAVRDT